MKCGPLKERPAAVSQAGRTARSRPSPPCKAGSAEGMVGEHLNEATTTRLGEHSRMRQYAFPSTRYRNFSGMASVHVGGHGAEYDRP